MCPKRGEQNSPWRRSPPKANRTEWGGKKKKPGGRFLQNGGRKTKVNGALKNHIPQSNPCGLRGAPRKAQKEQQTPMKGARKPYKKRKGKKTRLSTKKNNKGGERKKRGKAGAGQQKKKGKKKKGDILVE